MYRLYRPYPPKPLRTSTSNVRPLWCSSIAPGALTQGAAARAKRRVGVGWVGESYRDALVQSQARSAT